MTAEDILVTTTTGRPFNLSIPDPDEIRLDDIATALAHTCRFGGRIPRFYSTAQHSIFCAVHTPPEHRLWALLHDAAEAYVGDIVTPMKRQMPRVAEIENTILHAIITKHGLQWPMPHIVKHVDRRTTVTERNFFYSKFCKSHWAGWEDVEPFPGDIFPMSPHKARRHFMELYKALIHV